MEMYWGDSIIATDAQVLNHQAINTHSTDSMPVALYQFYTWNDYPWDLKLGLKEK